ncbi:MAG: YqiA/YcfP family alpha/beta fold hydrolase [Erysipelotrichaceae bacterium]
MKEIMIIGIHGFGRMRKEDFDFISIEMEKEQIKFYRFELFDEIKKPNWQAWVKTAYREIKPLCKEYDVILMGFSMGGVIATYLSRLLPIKKLILISPAFYYFGLDSGYRYTKRMIKMMLSKDDSFQHYIDERVLDAAHLKEFMKLVHYLRSSMKEVELPTLILQGSADEVIPVMTSKIVFHKIKSNDKQRILIEDGYHEFIRNKDYGGNAMPFIIDFITS